MILSQRSRSCRRCNAVLPAESLYCPSCGTLQVKPEWWNWSGATPPRPPGWYSDPIAHRPYRYWDGQAWSSYVSAPTLSEWAPIERDSFDVAPDPPLSPGTWRRGAIGLTFGGLFAAIGLSGFVAELWGTLGRPGGELALLLASETGLWVGFAITCTLVSTRFGSGNLRRDFHLRVRWFDPGIGLIGGVVGWLIAGLISLPFRPAHSLTNPDKIFGVTMHGSLAWTGLVLVVCVGAPLFEECFFRGLLQGVLVHRVGLWRGVGVTAVIFGACHVFNAPGIQGVAYALSIIGAGLILGIVYALTRRLGASIATHAAFNGLALAIFAAAAAH